MRQMSMPGRHDMLTVDLTPMRLFFLAMAIVAFSGCSGVQEEEQSIHQDVVNLHQEQDAISAAIKKIKVVSGANVKGHPQYTPLGRTQGYCFNQPNSTGGEVIHGDGLRAAAYRKYGDRVDAIVNTNAWFVPDDASGAFEPYTENGYFECAGTAVHFTGESGPAAAPTHPPAGSS
jgi:hypothetical protein